MTRLTHTAIATIALCATASCSGDERHGTATAEPPRGGGLHGSQRAPTTPTRTTTSESPPPSTAPPRTTVEGGFTRIQAQGIDGVIVPDARASAFYVGHYSAPSSYWTPSADEVMALERALPAHLAHAAAQLVPKLGRYKRQYVGVVENGARLVFANFFCDARPIEWMHRPVIVDDGGDCYFQIKYDPSTGAFSALNINGDA